jgi:hypothetical protein
MAKFKIGIIVSSCAFIFALIISVVPLHTPAAMAAKCKSEDSLSIISIKPWYSGVCKAGSDDVEIKSIPSDIIHIALNLLSIAVQLAGYAAVGLVIWGGIKYILASGEASKIASAKTTIQNALVGLLLVLVAITMVDFVTNLYK